MLLVSSLLPWQLCRLRARVAFLCPQHTAQGRAWSPNSGKLWGRRDGAHCRDHWLRPGWVRSQCSPPLTAEETVLGAQTHPGPLGLKEQGENPGCVTNRPCPSLLLDEASPLVCAFQGCSGERERGWWGVSGVWEWTWVGWEAALCVQEVSGVFLSAPEMLWPGQGVLRGASFTPSFLRIQVPITVWRQWGICRERSPGEGREEGRAATAKRGTAP